MEKIKYQSNYTERTGIRSYPFFGLVYIIVMLTMLWKYIIEKPELLFNIEIYLPLFILYFIAGIKLYSYEIRESGVWIKYNLFFKTKKLSKNNIDYIVFDDTKLKFKNRNKGIVMHIGIVQKTGKILYLNNNKEMGLLLRILKDENYKLKLNLTRTKLAYIYDKK